MKHELHELVLTASTSVDFIIIALDFILIALDFISLLS